MDSSSKLYQDAVKLQRGCSILYTLSPRGVSFQTSPGCQPGSIFSDHLRLTTPCTDHILETTSTTQLLGYYHFEQTLGSKLETYDTRGISETLHMRLTSQLLLQRSRHVKWNWKRAFFCLTFEPHITSSVLHVGLTPSEYVFPDTLSKVGRLALTYHQMSRGRRRD